MNAPHNKTNVDDYIGERYGKLVVTRNAGMRGKHVAVDCQCDCGNIITVAFYTLKHGRSASCGCSHNKRWIEILGKPAGYKKWSEEPTYVVWKSMVQRCHYETSESYSNYGARGITVCEEWRDNFAQFLKDMGFRPSGMQLDRRDNNLGYSKSNCRWVTPIVNQNNRRDNVYITLNGATHTVAEWVRITGINRSTIMSRYKRNLTPEQILKEYVN